MQIGLRVVILIFFQLDMPTNSSYTSYINTVVEALGLLLYTPLVMVDDETKSVPSVVALNVLPPSSSSSASTPVDLDEKHSRSTSVSPVPVSPLPKIFILYHRVDKAQLTTLGAPKSWSTHHQQSGTSLLSLFLPLSFTACS
jgi:hypothetical protein